MVIIHIQLGVTLIITIIIHILMAIIHTIRITDIMVIMDITEMAAEVFIAIIIVEAHRLIEVFITEDVFQTDHPLPDIVLQIVQVLLVQGNPELIILQLHRDLRQPEGITPHLPEVSIPDLITHQERVQEAPHLILTPEQNQPMHPHLEPELKPAKIIRVIRSQDLQMYLHTITAIPVIQEKEVPAEALLPIVHLVRARNHLIPDHHLLPAAALLLNTEDQVTVVIQVDHLILQAAAVAVVDLPAAARIRHLVPDQAAVIPPQVQVLVLVPVVLQEVDLAEDKLMLLRA